MKRVTLTVVAVLLAAPIAAHAKGGVIFDSHPDVQDVGSPMSFTVKTMPPREVVRIRATRSDVNGIAYGTLWVLSLSTIGSALLVAGMRRRRRWGAA